MPAPPIPPHRATGPHGRRSPYPLRPRCFPSQALAVGHGCEDADHRPHDRMRHALHERQQSGPPVDRHTRLGAPPQGGSRQLIVRDAGRGGLASPPSLP
jgi:hypothetical protein